MGAGGDKQTWVHCTSSWCRLWEADAARSSATELLPSSYV